MKKITTILTVAAVALGLSSCNADRDPAYQVPSKFVLNQPAMQDQYIELGEDGTIELACSQPDYGFSAVAQYSAQMSLDEDFTKVYDLASVDGTQARMQIKQSDVALGICELAGIKDQDAFNAEFGDGKYIPVFFRAVSQLDGVEGSAITSNVVYYNHLKPYFAVPVQGFIYLVGAPEGWAGPDQANAAHYADWRLFEPVNGIGSHIYTGVFNIPAGNAMFRFYTALTGWDADSYGSQEEDNPVEYPEFVDGSFTGTVVKGKGSFSFPNWQGGEMTITVDMSDMKNITITCQAGAQSVVAAKYIYVVGTPSGWTEPAEANAEHYKDYRLTDSTDSGIYTGTFDVPAGELSFKLYTELTGWDGGAALGAQAEDANVDCAFTNGVYTGGYVNGKGNWHFNVDADCTVDITLDTNAKTITVAQK